MPAVVLAVQRQPDANTVEVVDRSRRCCRPSRSNAGAPSIAAERPFELDPQAVEDVQFTLLLTIVLVVMVIFVFLRRSRRPSSRPWRCRSR
jgi:HAE1 family hydrophobic/amphiphilic exporter-1